MGFTKTKLLVAVTASALVLTACSDSNSGGAGGLGAGPGLGSGSGAGAPTPGKAGGTNSLKGLADTVKDKSAVKPSVHMEYTVNAQGMEITGEGDMDLGSELAMQMKMDMPTGSVEVRLVDRVMYVKIPQAAQTGKPWVKVDLDGTSATAKQLSGILDSSQQTNPTKILEQLGDAGEITSTKEETVDGVQTTRYSITVQVSKLKDKAMGMSEDALSQLQASGVKELPVDVWIDQDGLPVKYQVEMTIAGQKVKTVATYKDWGKPVTIKAPPASQVGELPGS
ncbi:hypothetical protein V5P93_006512 [Actinokineospora auranticolor]|uniref:Lipoprotein LprG n=1 Tax=Actinokineospora auranticolor TaxID=155976 RepID=A0A2S6GXC4_9PSEU|nr:hypothetical protein [Actinokineospora auranticolor]PPK69848.1 hypothetical protein CLV40_103458 [Actinokineospora auranticolor]